MIEDSKLSHVDEKGLPGMVDVSDKSTTSRLAIAQAQIEVGEQVMSVLKKEGFNTKKGSIIQTAIIAGTMSVKRTYDTIPLCHQIPISSCKIDIIPNDSRFDIKCAVKTIAQTGVEMEALHGASVAALTIYDMCKALTHDLKISNIVLLEKSGGKNDYIRKTS